MVDNRRVKFTIWDTSGNFMLINNLGIHIFTAKIAYIKTFDY